MVPSGSTPVDVAAAQKREPCVAVVGDDLGFAVAVGGFDPGALATALAIQQLAFLVPDERAVAIYRRAAAPTAHDRQQHVVPTETDPRPRTLASLTSPIRV